MVSFWEIAMTSFASVIAFATGSGHRSGGCQVVDLTEKCCARAAECQALANRWSGEGRKQYEALARQWLDLADRAAGPYGATKSREIAPEPVLVHG
jgi:hypothetical protein